jgi:hypothetical protein
MRVAGGVILIISAVINLFAALTYFAIGGAASRGAAARVCTDRRCDAQKQQGREMTRGARKAMASSTPRRQGERQARLR